MAKRVVSVKSEGPGSRLADLDDGFVDQRVDDLRRQLELAGDR